ASARLPASAAAFPPVARRLWAGLWLGRSLVLRSAARRVALDDLHLRTPDRQASSGHIFCYYRISGRGRVAADPDRGDENRVARDVGAIGNFRDVLFEAVPVGRDAAGADVDVGPDNGVTQIAEMRDGTAGADLGILDLGVSTDM